jgi:hypothetical protein
VTRAAILLLAVLAQTAAATPAGNGCVSIKKEIVTDLHYTT